MTANFKRFANENDIANAFREGWQAACNLHLRKPQGPGFNVAWSESDAFTRMQKPTRRMIVGYLPAQPIPNRKRHD